MSIVIKEQQLPQDLDIPSAVEAAYSTQLAQAASLLERKLPVLIECEKELAPFLYGNLRNRLKKANMKCAYLDGRANQENDAMSSGLINTMIRQLRDAVRGAVDQRVLVLPHLDLLTTSQGGLTSESREVIPLLYENPELVWLGFKDPSFPLPSVIENLFSHRIDLLGLARDRLQKLVTQREARKFGKEFNPWMLYKYVSGINAVRLRKLLSTLEGEDHPEKPAKIYQQLRQATLGGNLEIPEINLEKDIGGYARVKKRLRTEILDVLARKDNVDDPNEIRYMEELIPKGMIFWGPPGTGKTLFAKAMATAIGAAITIVSGPELKSKWVGESEERIRQIFHQARQSAPSIIVFDEMDSFASARGTYTGSGVEHSMVNQLLTELDGFHKEELVFVVGTTNFVEILDPALLRPGRFEFHLHIPYPDDDDRKEILQIYDKKMKLQFSEEGLEYAVKRTGSFYQTSTGTPFSGDHLNALCRAVARFRIREQKQGETNADDIERGLTEFDDKLVLTTREELLLATHESGHAICSLFCPLTPPIERITIRSETSWAPAYVRYVKDETRRLGLTRNQMLDDLCVLLGGIEAERLLLEDVSTGAAGSDLQRATQIAHFLVEIAGMGGPETGLRQYRSLEHGERERQLSQEQLAALDREVNQIIEQARKRAAELLKTNQSVLVTLRDLLLEKKELDASSLASVTDPAKTMKKEKKGKEQ